VRQFGEMPAPHASPPLPTIDPAWSEALLAWYERHGRRLPWRQAAEPYAVWVSEIMLQQTQVATVIPYYQRFLAAFPSLEVLAAADEDAVLRAWAGLGYYSRARNLHAAARELVAASGRVPDDPDALRRLPGVGRYTAGAIASLAFNRPAPILDGNVTRVLCRFFAQRGDPARAPLNALLWRLAETMIPAGRARDFNSALMDLGATVCTPADPGCGECPWQDACAGRREGLVARLPETAARPVVTPMEMVAAIAWRDGRALLVRRPSAASRWGGLWQFPNAERLPGEAPPETATRALREAAGIAGEVRGGAGSVRHSFTRYRITLRAYHLHCAGDVALAAGFTWAAPAEWDRYALPSPHARLAARLREGPPELPL